MKKRSKADFIVPSANKRSTYWKNADDTLECKPARIERDNDFYNKKEAEKCKDGYIMPYEERVKFFKGES